MTVDPTIDPTVEITGRPVSRTQASDASGRLPRYEAKCAHCATHVLPMGVSPFAIRYQGNGAIPANILMPLERQLIALQLCRREFLYNETLQQTSPPLLSKMSERRQI